jgi:hypothetical protein
MTKPEETIKNEEQKSTYLTEDKFKLIKQCQKDIFEAIQISLSIKKIIHELITEENTEKIKNKFINLYRD